MHEKLNETATEQIRALCRKIAVAHDLDEDIHEELYGHLEDKALAYLNGEEAVTEDDAVILVREHFGDPGAVKSLMQEVHRVESNVSFQERLAAIICVASVFAFLSPFVHQYMWSLVWTGTPLALQVCQVVILLPFAAGMPLFLWLILRNWQRRIGKGESLWFMNRSPFYLCVITGLFILLSLVNRYDPRASMTVVM